MTKEELIELIKTSNLSAEDITDINSIIENNDAEDSDVLNERIVLFFDKLNETLSNDSVKKIIEKITEFKSIKHEAAYKELKEKNEASIKIREKQNEHNAGARKYLTVKYWQDIFMVCVILATIGILNRYGKINESSTGTLLGAVIGYALGRFKNRTNEN